MPGVAQFAGGCQQRPQACIYQRVGIAALQAPACPRDLDCGNRFWHGVASSLGKALLLRRTKRVEIYNVADTIATAARQVRCPVAATLDVVGDRWTLLIIRDLLRGYSRFSQLQQSVEGITTSMLSDRIKRLESEGVIERRFYSAHPPRAEYVLTSKGHGLGVVVGALSAWGEEHTEHDLTLISSDCGHHVMPLYHCPTCNIPVQKSHVRIVESS
jgi:DNA-binding HxlR family transcriptional regulator